MLDGMRQQKLPCIVAVRGSVPSPPTTKVRGRGATTPVVLPQYEAIVGFSYACAYQYGLMFSNTGRSRYTLDLQLYVHPDHTRKGVGRCLLDRIIQCCSMSYA